VLSDTNLQIKTTSQYKYSVYVITQLFSSRMNGFGLGFQNRI